MNSRDECSTYWVDHESVHVVVYAINSQEFLSKRGFYSVLAEGSHEEQQWCGCMSEYNPHFSTTSYLVWGMMRSEKDDKVVKNDEVLC